MNTSDYMREIVVSCSPKDVYAALTSGFNQWWTLESGEISAVGDTVTFKFNTSYWVMRTNILSPNFIELECIEAHHVHTGLPSSILKEWLGTKLKWRIQQQQGGTRISLTHEGLVQSLDCFEICQQGWDYFFVTSLKKYLNEGEGLPFGADE